MPTAIVYFSLTGNTAWAAGRIAEALGAETLRLEPEKAYPARGAAKFLLGGKSAVFGEAPPLRPYSFDPDAFDRVIFGFPVWAGRPAPPLRSFLKAEGKALKGKTFAAFACQSGAGGERALRQLEEALGAELKAKLILIDPGDRPSEGNEARIAAFCGACR
ncbi:MAG: NAD(P)H-dependent oxidoreductase [Oscillospiraceae bacterium]|nr:NAD(P)H-dependent oxidoreductase [Oscillospiraceae bacterium]